MTLSGSRLTKTTELENRNLSTTKLSKVTDLSKVTRCNGFVTKQPYKLNWLNSKVQTEQAFLFLNSLVVIILERYSVAALLSSSKRMLSFLK